MRCAVLTKPYTFALEEREIPVCGPGEVLLRMKQVGICGSDMQKYHGKHQHLKMPQIIGHECVAVIEEIGASAAGPADHKFYKGQRVTLFPQISCGECPACRAGFPNLCQIQKFAGLQIPGFFQDFVAMPAGNVVPLSEKISDDLGMLTEPAAVAVHAMRLGSIKNGSRVVVIGAGTIGHLILELSHGIGAKTLVAESLESRASAAKRVGTDVVFDGPMDRLGEAVKDAFGPDGADVFVISRAVAKDLDTILHQVNVGATVVIVGNYKEPATVDWTVIERRELTVKGSLRYLRKDFDQAVSYLEQGLVNADAIITHRFPFVQVADAFRLADEHFKDALKVALHFEDN